MLCHPIILFLFCQNLIAFQISNYYVISLNDLGGVRAMYSSTYEFPAFNFGRIVLEFKTGDASSHNLILNHKRLSEAHTRFIIKGLFKCVTYLHNSTKKSHRDLKLQNVLMVKPVSRGRLEVGRCNLKRSGELFEKRCKTRGICYGSGMEIRDASVLLSWARMEGEFWKM